MFMQQYDYDWLPENSSLDIQVIENYFSSSTAFDTSINIEDNKLLFHFGEDSCQIVITLDIGDMHNESIDIHDCLIEQAFVDMRYFEEGVFLPYKTLFKGLVYNLKHLKNILLAVFTVDDAKNLFGLTIEDLQK